MEKNHLLLCIFGFTILASLSHQSTTPTQICCNFEANNCQWADDSNNWVWSSNNHYPDTIDTDITDYETRNSSNEWLQKSTPTQAEIIGWSLQFNENDNISIQFYRHIVTTPDEDRLTLSVKLQKGTNNKLIKADKEGWNQYYHICANKTCCQEYPCTSQLRIEGLVNNSNELLAFDDITVNDCLITTTSTTPTTTPTTTTPTTTTTLTTTTETTSTTVTTATTEAAPTSETTLTTESTTTVTTTTVTDPTATSGITTPTTAAISSTTSPTSPTSPPDTGLSSGEITGIVIGSVCFVVLVLLLLMFVRMRSRRNKKIKKQWPPEREADLETIYSGRNLTRHVNEPNNMNSRSRPQSVRTSYDNW